MILLYTWCESKFLFNLSEDTFNNDIALIKIKPKDGHGITYSDHVQPACLPDANTVHETGKKCHVSGWGKTEHGLYCRVGLEKLLNNYFNITIIETTLVLPVLFFHKCVIVALFIEIFILDARFPI